MIDVEAHVAYGWLANIRTTSEQQNANMLAQQCFDTTSSSTGGVHISYQGWPSSTTTRGSTSSSSWPVEGSCTSP